MARYTGPKTKIARRYGVPLFGPSKSLERKNYPPGMHGPKGSRRKQSDYAIALGEKQKLRFQYGLMEKQFRRIFETALQRRGVTGETCSSFSRLGSTTSFSASVSRTLECGAPAGLAWPCAGQWQECERFLVQREGGR